jgi:hypothetical protein
MSYNIPKDTNSTLYLSCYQLSFDDIRNRINEKWPGISDDDIAMTAVMEKTSGCGCHSSAGDYEPFLEIENIRITSAMKEIETGLQAYFTEDGRELKEDDESDILEEAKRLMYERGLGQYEDGIKARIIKRYDGSLYLSLTTL